MMEMLQLCREAASQARSLKYVQSRIDEDTITARNRTDQLADCLKRIGVILRDQFGFSGVPVLQLNAIHEVKPVARSVYDLKWKKTSRASFEIYINGNQAKPVALTRQEWEFLKFLATNRPDPRDGLAATRSLDELVAHISEGKSKTGDTKKYINHMVSRIRIALAKQGFDPEFVRRDDQLGVRFAFRGNL